MDIIIKKEMIDDLLLTNDEHTIRRNISDYVLVQHQLLEKQKLVNVDQRVSPTERTPIEVNNTAGALETAKRWALVGFDDWNAVTGYVPSNTGYYFEITSIIEDAVEYGFGVANNQDLKTIKKRIKEGENGLNKIKQHKP